MALFVALSLATAYTFLPQPDEAVYANPGYNLLYNGHAGTTLYELRGYMPLSMAERTYWQPPLYFFATPVWFKFVGFGIFQVRMFSLIFGTLGVFCWYFIVSRLTSSTGAGLFAMGLVATDLFYVLSSSTGRMDMMCAGLGTASIAAYVSLRDRSMTRALFALNLFATLSILAHPAGMLYWLGAVLLVLTQDRKALSVRAVAISAAPILAGIAAWGLYILPDPAAFQAQMKSVIEINKGSFDTSGLSSFPVVRSLQLEWRHRYEAPFGFGAGVGLVNRVKILVFTAYVSGMGGALLIPSLRRRAGLPQLAMLALIAMGYLAFGSPSKYYYYLAHVTGFMAACLGAVLYALWEQPGKPRMVSLLTLLAIVSIGLSGSLFRIRANPMHRSYMPAVAAARQHSTTQSLIMSSGELWFGLQPDRSVLYDPNLGALSGKVPDVIVWAGTERSLSARARKGDPALYEHERRILDSKQLVYQDTNYEIYAIR